MEDEEEAEPESEEASKGMSSAAERVVNASVDEGGGVEGGATTNCAFSVR